MKIPRGRVYLPFRKVYFLIYLVMALLFLNWIATFMSLVATKFFGLPSWLAVLIVFLSLIGSAVNIPLFYVRSYRVIVKPAVVRFFFVEWVIPEVDWEEQKTLVAVNVGGAVIPVIISAYLLVKIVLEEGLLGLVQLAVATTIATIGVNKVAKPIPGIGIATPGIVPPLLTLVSVFLVHPYITPGFFAMLYVTGTLSTLIGADIMNLDRIPELGAPVASIGGAGTFDGVFLTGLMAIWLAILF